MTLPSFVGVGASKSGTTSLARWLQAHPDLFVAPEKEIRYFTLHWERGLDWYAEWFAAAGDRPAGEVTPDYMNDPVAVERLAATLPDAQLLVCLREPVARLLSHYWHQRWRGGETRSLRAAVEGHADYVARGHYLPQLERLAEHYPRERIHVVLFDNLVAAPAEAFASTCRFLGVDDTVRPAVLGTAFNTAGAFRSKQLRLGMLRAGAFARAPGLSARIDQLNRRSVLYPEPTTDERRFLADACRFDVPALEGWLGQRLPADWTIAS